MEQTGTIATVSYTLNILSTLGITMCLDIEPFICFLEEQSVVYRYIIWFSIGYAVPEISVDLNSLIYVCVFTCLRKLWIKYGISLDLCIKANIHVESMCMRSVCVTYAVCKYVTFSTFNALNVFAAVQRKSQVNLII